MADNNFEHPGPDEPAGGSPPESHFPADFFDESAEPSPVSLTPGESSSHHPAPPVLPPYPPAPPVPPADAHEPPPPVSGPPSSYKAPAVEPFEDEGIKMSAFPAVLGVVMAAVLVVAWFVSKQPAVVAAAPAPAAAPSSAAEPPPPPPATTAITDAIDARVKGLADDLDELMVQVKANEARLNALPKPEPAPDLKPIEAKLEELGKSVAAVAPVGAQVGKLGARVGSVDGELKTIKGELAALKTDVQKASAAAKPASEPKPAADETATALNGGVELFKAGKYPQADEVFKKLAAGNPKDARVYYYAALTHGLTTNDWQGETMTIANKGADLEKAGAPKSPEIDTTFADLPPNLKPWLTFFRRAAK